MFSANISSLIFAGFLAALPSAAPPKEGNDAAESLVPGERTLLIYSNRTSQKASKFVIRVARYQPDIVLEWESVADQGTVHLHRKAVSEGDGFTLSSHFQVGVQVESQDVMTVWLSRESFGELSKGQVTLKMNRLPLKLTRDGKGVFSLQANKRTVEIPVIHATDARGGKWAFYDNPENPLLVVYESPYYRQQLETFSTQSDQKLRWITKLPPIQ